MAEKSRKKEREYARKLQDLRRRTRVSLYLAEATTGGNGRNDDEVVPSSSMVGGTGRRATPHEHVFRDDDNGADADGETVRQCTLCGLAVVVDEF